MSGLNILPLGNGASDSLPTSFPKQYWPNTNMGGITVPNLNCPSAGSSSSAFSPSIDFVATQFTTQAVTYSTSCDAPESVSLTNPCQQVIRQGTQTEINTYQPPSPLTVVGTGFGYLSGLPWYGTNPPNIVVHDITAGWSTLDGSCAVYISDWADNAISLQVGLPVGITNGAGTPLSVLTALNPMSFFQVMPGNSCQIALNDQISVTVTNPQQTGNYEQLPNATLALPTSTTPH